LARRKIDVRVFVTSWEIGEGAWRTHEDKLRRFYELSSKKHALVDTPEAADIIVIGNVRNEVRVGHLREDDRSRNIQFKELMNAHPDKCFSVSDLDVPLILNRGVYASGTRSLVGRGRVRTGSYTMYADSRINVHVKNHVFSPSDFTERKYLFSFIGRNCHAVRNAIFRLRFRRADLHVEDSSAVFNWSMKDSEDGEERMRQYYEVLKHSKFSLCPRGAGASTIRLFESMQLGVAPVIISDRWVLPTGPDWSRCSILVKEKHVRHLEDIVEGHEKLWREMGILARAAFDRHFAENVYFDYIVDNCIDMRQKQLVPEHVYWKLSPLVSLVAKARATARAEVVKARAILRPRTRLRAAMSAWAKRRHRAGA
jgi:hypothetical protein